MAMTGGKNSGVSKLKKIAPKVRRHIGVGSGPVTNGVRKAVTKVK